MDPEMSSHAEQLRQILEMECQCQEAWRTAWLVQRFGPAVDGVLWSRRRPGNEGHEGPQTPILSILEFTPKPGIDIGDEARPPRKLWDAALRYTSSVPGCGTIEWGSTLDEASPAVLLVLIHWDSTAAWQRFQWSLGFSPIIALLGSPASNRCAKLGVSGSPRLGATAVDVITVTFAADGVSSPERRSGVEESWRVLIASACKGHVGPRHSHYVWLENDATLFANPCPADFAAASATSTFVAFLAWDEDHHSSRRLEDLCDGLRASLLSSYGIEPTISTKAVRLVDQVQRIAHSTLQQAAAPLTSLASILKTGVSPLCSADLICLRRNASEALQSSIRDARAGTRHFPAPSGSFISQGELYEGNMPALPEWRITHGPIESYHVVDLVWMQLKRLSLRVHGPRIYNEITDEISALPGFVQALWARDVEDDTKFSLLTVWTDQQARLAALNEYLRVLDNVVLSSVRLTVLPTHQVFPIVRDAAGIGLDLGRYLEITCFQVPRGTLERQLFEHAYAAFGRMTEPSQQAGIPVACRAAAAGGWQPENAAAASSDYQVFIGAMTWDSPTARQEWYAELFRLSCGSYELFGHQLEALRILAAGGVDARFLILQSSTN